MQYRVVWRGLELISLIEHEIRVLNREFETLGHISFSKPYTFLPDIRVEFNVATNVVTMDSFDFIQI